MSAERPLRNLAAWGYESASSGTRVEVDVWTVNAGESDDDDDDALERAIKAFAADSWQPTEAFGNVARVEYPGIGTEGYRYIDSGEKATQQAFAGSKRSAGGTRTGAGTFGEGFSSPDEAPDIDEVIAHGSRNVLPVARRELGQLGQSIGREPSSDEEDEPTQDPPFDGFRNVVRVFPGTGNVKKYRVEGIQFVDVTHEPPEGRGV